MDIKDATWVPQLQKLRIFRLQGYSSWWDLFLAIEGRVTFLQSLHCLRWAMTFQHFLASQPLAIWLSTASSLDCLWTSDHDRRNLEPCIEGSHFKVPWHLSFKQQFPFSRWHLVPSLHSMTFLFTFTAHPFGRGTTHCLTKTYSWNWGLWD